eukprot:gene46-biopygen219
MQSTLERESNVPETAVRQAYETCARPGDWQYLGERKRFGVVQSDGSVASPGICQHGLPRGEASSDVLPSGDIRGSHTTRLETRTKESIHVCEYASAKLCERICWDPKDGELCLSRVKPGETLVEARSDTDVQIVKRMIRGLGDVLVLDLFSNFKWVRSTRLPKRISGFNALAKWAVFAGRWSWKLKPAKECVTTHLPNGLAPKMDGAAAGDRYPIANEQIVALACRRANAL